MHIGHHAANIPLGVRAALLPRFILAGVDVLFNIIGILKKIAVINRIELAPLRTFYVGMAQTKFTNRRVEGKTINTSPRGINKHGGRAINNIAGRYLCPALL